MNKYYYFGEFGYFNLEVLGGLERYFEKNPNKKIVIETYKNYGDLLEILFPKNVKIIKRNAEILLKERERFGHYLILKRDIEKMPFCLNKYNHPKEKNIIHLYRKYFNLSGKTTRWDCIDLPLKKKISLNKDSKEEFISICPRKRNLCELRNIKEIDWKKILKILKKFNLKIVLHGAFGEFIKLKGKQIIYPKNIEEQIFYLNNSIFCISPNSGFAHFSLNCGCNNLVIEKEYYKFINYNPFKKRLYCCSLNEILNSEIIDKFFYNKKISSWDQIKYSFLELKCFIYNKIIFKFVSYSKKYFPNFYLKLRHHLKK